MTTYVLTLSPSVPSNSNPIFAISKFSDSQWAQFLDPLLKVLNKHLIHARVDVVTIPAYRQNSLNGYPYTVSYDDLKTWKTDSYKDILVFFARVLDDEHMSNAMDTISYNDIENEFMATVSYAIAGDAIAIGDTYYSISRNNLFNFMNISKQEIWDSTHLRVIVPLLKEDMFISAKELPEERDTSNTTIYPLPKSRHIPAYWGFPNEDPDVPFGGNSIEAIKNDIALYRAIKQVWQKRATEA